MGGGLTHLWSKIKQYLGTWKTSNFGTGTYENSGRITLNSGARIYISESTCISVDGYIPNTQYTLYNEYELGFSFVYFEATSIVVRNETNNKKFFCFIDLSSLTVSTYEINSLQRHEFGGVKPYKPYLICWVNT